MPLLLFVGLGSAGAGYGLGWFTTMKTSTKLLLFSAIALAAYLKFKGK